MSKTPVSLLACKLCGQQVACASFGDPLEPDTETMWFCLKCKKLDVEVEWRLFVTLQKEDFEE